ncbi:hypothetical protein TrRE_jg7318, partial [Triparma retinervis]
ILGDTEVKVKVPRQELGPGVNSYGVFRDTYSVCHSARYKPVVVKGTGSRGEESYSKPAAFEYEFEDMKGRWELCERAKKKRAAALQQAKENKLGFKVVPNKRYFKVELETLEGMEFEMGEKYLAVSSSSLPSVKRGDRLVMVGSRGTKRCGEDIVRGIFSGEVEDLGRGTVVFKADDDDREGVL